MIRRLCGTLMLLSYGSLACAGAPLTLSDPVPAISGLVYAGDSNSYTYTITNNTNRTIAVVETISGNSTSSSVTTQCTSVPAAGSCEFIVTLQPAVLDYLLPGGIQDTVNVHYAGRLPTKITGPIQATVEIPALNTLTVTPSATAYTAGVPDTSGVPTTLGGGYVTYIATAMTANGALLDLTPLVTWDSTNEDVASVPNSDGQATTFFVGDPGGTSIISAEFGGVNSNDSTLQVNDRAYVSQIANSQVSPWLCTVINATTGVLSSCADVTNAYQDITYTAINSDARYIYMANQTGSIYTCPLNAVTGQYGISSTCSQVRIASNKIGAVKLSPNNKNIYVLAANDLYTCQVTQATGALTGCRIQTAILNRTKMRAFAIDPSGSYMYIMNDPGTSPYMQTCALNQDTGAISNCVAQSPSNLNTNNNTVDMTAIDTTSGTYIYGSYFISGGAWDGNVLVCQANTSTGTVSSCSYSLFDATMQNPAGVSMSNKSSGPFQLYVADSQAGRIHNCLVGSDFVTFSACQQINSRANNAGILVR